MMTGRGITVLHRSPILSHGEVLARMRLSLLHAVAPTVVQRVVRSHGIPEKLRRSVDDVGAGWRVSASYGNDLVRSYLAYDMPRVTARIDARC
jgi:hypothetical protein